MLFHLFHHTTSPFKKFVAEAIGTFALTFAVIVSFLQDFPLPTPVVAGLVVGVFVYTIGRISGAHINPAVTIALFSIRKITAKDAAGYIVAQIVGAAIAMGVARWALGDLPSPSVQMTPEVVLGECLGAFILVFGICAVIHGKVGDSAAGLVIGGSLLVGILVASALSNGVLNPAVAFGIRSLSVFYVFAPILGGLLGAWSYCWLEEGAWPLTSIPPKKKKR